MKLRNTHLPRQTGFSMIEVMVALVILLFGLLGLAGLMVHSQRSETESYQRVQALILLQDMVTRINANRKVASCYAISDGSSGTPFLGTGSSTTPTCTAGTAEQNALAIQDMQDWNDLLKGAAEVSSGGNNIGAMIDARGCVSFDATTSTYLVSVAWQGMGKTKEPPDNWSCAKGLYGNSSDGDNDRERRVVSVAIQIANLG
jgi:type IV pilus assembly protein PilV